jgi:hypothetical protein
MECASVSSGMTPGASGQWYGDPLRSVAQEAETVSERIRRSLEAQYLRTDPTSLDRLRLGRDRDAELARAEENGDAGTLVIAPFGLRSFTPHRPPSFRHHRSAHRPERAVSRPMFLRGSASPESR